jgi:ATP-binding cassette subfamily F protein 3
MRLVARRMRDKAEEMEEEMVDVRKEDRTIRAFTIPSQEGLIGEVLGISSYKVIKGHKPVVHKAKVSLKRGGHLQLAGPNGIGKSTLLESLANGTAEGATIQKDVKVGYYRQDFSTLNFDDTVYDSLMAVMDKKDEERMRSVAAGFLLSGEVVRTKIGSLSEGQKGLVAFARLVLEKPGLLILDEPTNHINFRHLPVIAEALNTYQGAMILVSHVPDFVAKIRIDEVLDLGK